MDQLNQFILYKISENGSLHKSVYREFHEEKKPFNLFRRIDKPIKFNGKQMNSRQEKLNFSKNVVHFRFEFKMCENLTDN